MESLSRCVGDYAGPWGLMASGKLQSLPSGTWDKLNCHIKVDTNKHAECMTMALAGNKEHTGGMH